MIEVSLDIDAAATCRCGRINLHRLYAGNQFTDQSRAVTLW
jgi:hypothetical protein